jgi:hypothetical protein
MLLTHPFERLREDGLVRSVDPAASARALLAAAHPAAHVEAMTHRGSRRDVVAHLEALVEVLWVGLSPARRAGVGSSAARAD